MANLDNITNSYIPAEEQLLFGYEKLDGYLTYLATKKALHSLKQSNELAITTNKTVTASTAQNYIEVIANSATSTDYVTITVDSKAYKVYANEGRRLLGSMDDFTTFTLALSGGATCDITTFGDSKATLTAV